MDPPNKKSSQSRQFSLQALGVGRHEQFKTEDAIQEVLFHIAVPGSLLPGKFLIDVLDDKVRESGRAGGRVEDERAFVGQTFRAVEPGPQQVVDGADDVADRGFGRGKDTAELHPPAQPPETRFCAAGRAPPARRMQKPPVPGRLPRTRPSVLLVRQSRRESPRPTPEAARARGYESL